MAVEVSAQRQLHEHALPVALLLLGVMLLVTATYGSFRDLGIGGEVSLGQALVTQVIHIHPTSNGLASVSLVTGSAPTPKALGSASSAGQAANLSFSFDR